MFKSLTNVLFNGRQIAALALLLGSTIGAQAISQSEIDKILVKTSPEIFGLFKAEFRSDYDALVGALEVAEAEGGDIRGTTAGQIAAWRVSQADVIVSASDEDHIEMLSHYTDTLAQLRDAAGGENCGNYILYGAGGLTTPEADATHVEMTTQYLISLMEAAVSARDTPARRKVASDADWDHAFAIMEERGGTPADLDAIIAMDALDPAFCDATIRFVDALLVDGDKAVSRVRAEYVGYLVSAL